MLSTIYSDLCVTSNTLLGRLKSVIGSHTFHMVLLIRLGQTVAIVPLIGSLLRIMVEYLIRIIFASDVSCKARIGPGLLIMHGHDIVIGSNVTIGSCCKIFNGVTLGNRNTEIALNDHPTIGDHVVIGTGSKILGGIKLGDYSKVGANSVVLSDVPACGVAIGVPAKIK